MALKKNVLVEMPAHCVRTKKNGAVYVQYTIRAYRNEKGKPTSERVSIGKEDPETGLLIPNRNYYEYVEKRKQIELPAFIRSCGTYRKVKSVIDTWHEDGIYAISFFVYSNEAYEYKGFSNVSSFAISYNTEEDCEGAGPYDEERWNYAFWRQDETPIIDPDDSNGLTDLLFAWYKENGITNIGEEDEDRYDEDLHYIGKGPVGHYELLTLVCEVARRLQQEGYLENKFGKKIPIIIHGLEYTWYDIEATQKANINGSADTFLNAMKELGMI